MWDNTIPNNYKVKSANKIVCYDHKQIKIFKYICCRKKAEEKEQQMKEV